MLTEHFIASVGVPTRPSGTNIAKDASIFIQEYQPLKVQRTVFRTSATAPNCLAVSACHVFAAQAEKAVVHVYNREKGNQEATVPFTERITCVTLACNESVLVLGTAEGRIFVWETASGRQVTTAQSHLQAVTALVVDLNSNFLLSASADSTVHVWSIPSLLSFSSSIVELPSPLRTFTSHRAKVNALVLGHSSSFCNIAVSASIDRTCIVWDYFTNTVLRTYLLPSGAACLALDVADRGVYVGYEDGSIQQLDLFAPANDSGVGLNHVSSSKDASAPVQPPQSSRWYHSNASIGATLCITIPFDGCTVISGHQSGVILLWDSARSGSPTSLLQTPLPGPVTNLSFLPVIGFTNERKQTSRIQEIVKPKFGAYDSSSGAVPGNYCLNFELVSNILDGSSSVFERALSAPSFPTTMIDEGINELLTWGRGNSVMEDNRQEGEEDFMALDDEERKPRQLSLEEQNASLKFELEALRRLQKASFEKIERIDTERKALVQREQKRISGKHSNNARAEMNGGDRMYREVNESSSSSDER